MRSRVADIVYHFLPAGRRGFSNSRQLCPQSYTPNTRQNTLIVSLKLRWHFAATIFRMYEPVAGAAVHLKVSAMDCRKVRRSGKRSSLMSTAVLSDRFASRPKRTIHDPFGEPVKAAKRILVVDDCSDGRR